jgi:hypothetical protein
MLIDPYTSSLNCFEQRLRPLVSTLKAWFSGFGVLLLAHRFEFFIRSADFFS